MRKTFVNTEWFKKRNESLNLAGNGIEKAREAIDQLEHIVLATVHGEFPDIHKVVDLTAALKRAHDDILIGIVESSAVPPTSKTMRCDSNGRVVEHGSVVR